MKSSEQAIASFFKEIQRLSQEVEKLVFGYGTDLQKRDALLNLAIFTRIVEDYERLIGRDKLIPLDELALNLYNSYLNSKNYRASNWIITIDPYQIGNVIVEYYALAAGERSAARLRSDELMAIKPQASVASHKAVWRSNLPVDLICSTVNSYDNFHVSGYERQAYQLGHDTKLWRRYGYSALMMLSPDQLSQAEDRFLDLEPQGNLKELSVIAKLKSNSMNADIFLKLLDYGYSSADQLRQAGEILGVKIRSRDYFSQVMAGGPDLAGAAKRAITAIV